MEGGSGWLETEERRPRPAAPSEEQTQREQLGKSWGLCPQSFHICKVGKQQRCNEK